MYAVKVIDQFKEDQLTDLGDRIKRTDCDTKADGILLRSSQLPPELITDQLLGISRAGTGVNTINVLRCTEKGIAVMNTPGANANAVKELVLTCLFLAARPVVEAAKMVQQLQGTDILLQAEQKRSGFIGEEVQGKVVGLIGLGAIGKLVADSCYELGMEVLGYNRSDPELDHVEMVSLEVLLRTADFVILLLPLTEATENILDRKRLRLLKPTAVLLNFGRGPLADSQAICELLAVGCFARYITDFPEEDFLDNPKIWMLPHIGGTTKQALEGSGKIAIRSLRSFLLNGTIRDSVNFPAVRLPFRSPYRLTLFYEDRRRIWRDIMAVLAKHEWNLGDIASNRKDAIVYSLINIEDTGSEEDTAALLAELTELKGIRRVRFLKRSDRS